MATSPNTKISVKVKVLTTPSTRKNSIGTTAVTAGIDSISKSIKTIYLPLSKIHAINIGCYYKITNVSMGEYIKVSENALILECSKFKDYPQEVEDGFYHPPVLTIPEALASPRKRRATIRGQLTEVSGLLQSDNSTRKILKLSSGPDTIQVKLWGEQTHLQIPPIGQDIEVSCITIEEFRGNKEGNSSEITQIKEDAEKENFEGLIDACAFEMNEASVLFSDSDSVYTVDSDLLESIYPTLRFSGTTQVKGTRCGSRILTMEHIKMEDP